MTMAAQLIDSFINTPGASHLIITRISAGLVSLPPGCENNTIVSTVDPHYGLLTFNSLPPTHEFFTGRAPKQHGAWCHLKRLHRRVRRASCRNRDGDGEGSGEKVSGRRTPDAGLGSSSPSDGSPSSVAAQRGPPADERQAGWTGVGERDGAGEGDGEEEMKCTCGQRGEEVEASEEANERTKGKEKEKGKERERERSTLVPAISHDFTIVLTPRISSFRQR